MERNKQQLGKRGEELALQFLRRNGYKIIARNFSCRFGEIDIIARQGITIVFIEVKTRSTNTFGLPEDALDHRKIERLRRTAQFYIQKHAQPEGQFRFDVVSIVWEQRPKIGLIRDILA